MSAPRRVGITLVEALLALALFAVLAVLVLSNLRFHTMAETVVEKLDTLARLRVAELKVRAELETATEILHPAAGDEVGASGLVFAGPTNQLAILYLDPQGNLKLRRDGQEVQVLVGEVAELKVRQPVRGQAECVIKADTKERGRVSLVVSAAVGNSFLSEGILPP